MRGSAVGGPAGKFKLIFILPIVIFPQSIGSPPPAGKQNYPPPALYFDDKLYSPLKDTLITKQIYAVLVIYM